MFFEDIEDITTARPPAYRQSSIMFDVDAKLPKVNGLQSCIDTLVSKISQYKVRPYITPVNSTFEAVQAGKACQDCLDLIFDKNCVYQKGALAFKAASIFEYGAMWIDDLEADPKNQIVKLDPWQFLFDAVEYQTGELFTFCIRFKTYPTIKLRKKFPKFDFSDDLPYCCYEVYYNLYDGVRYDYINQKMVKKTIGYDYAPVALLWFRPPLKGGMTSTLSDDLIPLQDVLDKILWKISDASETSPANMIFVSGLVKESEITSESGMIYRVQPEVGGGSSPVSVVTSPFVDKSYLDWAGFLLEKMYSITGVSQMSASAQKPAGVTSGIAIQTLDDIESDRHNIPTSNMVQFYLDIALCYIYTMARDGKAPMPARQGRASVSWGKVKEQIENLTFQFSPVSITSKNPETKLQTIQQIMAEGGDLETAIKYLQIQDDSGFIDILTASYEANEFLINEWINGKTDEIPDQVNLKGLINQATQSFLIYYKNDCDKKQLANIANLIQAASKKIKKVQQVQAVNSATANGQMQMLTTVTQNKANFDAQQLTGQPVPNQNPNQNQNPNPNPNQNQNPSQ